MRRRFVWIQGGIQYKAAILYEVVNGSNSEIWLQDDGAEPVLITTVPQRMSVNINRSISIATFGTVEDQVVGEIARIMAFNNGPSFSPRAIQLSLIDDPFLSDLTRQEHLQITRTFSRVGTQAAGTLGLGGSSFIESPVTQAFRTLYRTYVSGFTTDPVLRRVYHAINNQFGQGPSSLDTTLIDIGNRIRPILQRRAGQSIVYLKSNPYHDQLPPGSSVDALGTVTSSNIDNSEIVFDPNTANVWNQFLCWVNGQIEASSIPSDPTRHIAETPFRLIHYAGSTAPLSTIEITNRRNILSTDPYRAMTLSNSFNFATLLNDGAIIETGFNIETINGETLSTETPVESVQIKGAPANARQVLSVAIYPA